jgi:hypothetical protein
MYWDKQNDWHSLKHPGVQFEDYTTYDSEVHSVDHILDHQWTGYTKKKKWQGNISGCNKKARSGQKINVPIWHQGHSCYIVQKKLKMTYTDWKVEENKKQTTFIEWLNKQILDIT